jgi:nicotinamidase-related amidase
MIIPALTPHNSVLLVIDVINSCAAREYEDPERHIHFSRIRQMVPRLSNFMLSWQALGGRLILTTTVPWQEASLPENINALYRNNPQACYWSKDASGQAERFYQIPTQAALVFAKDTYDAFTNAALVRALEEMQSRYIVVAGVFGDGCVMASICGGFSRGYALVIARDLIETTDDTDRQALQQHLKQTTWPLMYGTTIDSGQILAALSPSG